MDIQFMREGGKTYEPCSGTEEMLDQMRGFCQGIRHEIAKRWLPLGANSEIYHGKPGRGGCLRSIRRGAYFSGME